MVNPVASPSSSSKLLAEGPDRKWIFRTRWSPGKMTRDSSLASFRQNSMSSSISSRSERLSFTCKNNLWSCFWQKNKIRSYKAVSFCLYQNKHGSFCLLWASNGRYLLKFIVTQGWSCSKNVYSFWKELFCCFLKNFRNSGLTPKQHKNLPTRIEQTRRIQLKM